MRTYVRTPDGELTMDGWFQGLRDGHAYVSSGPLIDFTIDGMGPGDDLSLDGPGEVQLRGRVWGVVPMVRAELVRNGEVVRSWEFTGDRKELMIDDRLTVSGSGWVHLRVEGAPGDSWPLDTSYPQAFTNPVWITVGGRPIRSAAASDYAIRWIDKLQAMADEWPGWRSEREREHVFAQFEQAREVYRQRGAEAEGGAGPGGAGSGLPQITEQVSGSTDVLQAISPVSEDAAWVSGHGGVDSAHG